MFDFSALKICFLAGTLGQGGAERQLYYALYTLRECGAVPRVLCLTRGEFWEERIQALGVPVTWVGQYQSRLVRLLYIILAIKGSPPDVLQSQHIYTNLYAVAAARLLGLREIGALRNDGLTEVWETGKLTGPWSVRFPRYLAANSKNAIRNARIFRKKGDRILFLPNVVDTSRFRPGPVRDLTRHPVRLITVGRLTKQKRMDRFLSVVARLSNHRPGEVEAVIVGDGPERDQLERQAARCNLLPGVVRFTGFLTDVALQYQKADIFVQTSDWEGTPNVILEAMACGLPVVATRVGGIPDIIVDGEAGFLIDPQNMEKMEAVLLRLIEDTKYRRTMGEKGRTYVKQQHALERMPVILERFYMTVLG